VHLNNKKTIGILGGLGPEATALFFHEIIRKTPAEKDQEHIKIVIYNNPEVPDRTDAIVNNLESPLDKICEGLIFLRDANVDFITIPCVTSHYYFEEIRNSVDIPVLNIVQETFNFIKREYPLVKNVGILATRGTYQGHVFENIFVPQHVSVIVPGEESQKCIMNAVYGKEGIKAGNTTGAPKDSIVKIANELTGNGAEVIIGGCTEIPIVVSNGDLKVPFINTLSVLAEAAVSLAGLTPTKG